MAGEPEAEPLVQDPSSAGADPRKRTLWTRRTALSAAGAGILVAATGCGPGVTPSGRPPGAAARRGSVEGWARTRGDVYYIAHRGAGDVYPEHTMPAYRAALGWGAPAIEVSTRSSKDGVLVCMHDPTLDRTTDSRGPVKGRSWADLQRVGVLQPQLGPAWTRPPLTKIPSLEQVLKGIGGRAVLCLEAKDDADYPLMVDLVEKYRLQDSVVIKLFHRSSRRAEARAAGYPLFVYLGGDDTSAGTIRSVAGGLRRATDYLALPTTDQAGADLPDATVRTAVDTGVPTWVYPVHRRSEAERYRSLGVEGIITSSLQYVSGRSAAVTADGWESKAIASGEMTRHPDRAEDGPTWTGQDELTLEREGAQRFVTLGQFSPLADPQGHYRITFDARWNKLPADLQQGFTLAFGHADDAYYEHRLGLDDGYHAIHRANGALTLFAHTAGDQDGSPLSGTVSVPTKTGTWMSMRLEVSPSTLVWSRLGGGGPANVVATDSRFRGGYLHIGRHSEDGSLSLRRLRVERTS